MKDKKSLIEIIEKQRNLARAAIVAMTTLAKSGHPGGSMSCIDIILSLYNTMNIDPKDYWKEGRDQLVVSNGHISPAIYTSAALTGFVELEDVISQFRLIRSIFEGHVEPYVPTVEWASGNLGQGLSAACGFALASRVKNIDNQIYVIMGDGEQQKGQISEARRFAKKYNLNNITCFIDYNQLQIGGDINDVMPQDIIANYKSDKWEVLEIDGHNISEILDAIEKAKTIDSPVMILAHTVMGKGVSFMENKEKYHGSTLHKEDCIKAIKELGVDLDLDKYEQIRNELYETTERVKYSRDFSEDMSLNESPVRVYTEKTDNRSAWGNALTDFANANLDSKTKIAVFDCDLMGSVKTDGFQKVMPDNFFQAGIMEHHTAVCAAAMSKMGIQTFFADFGVFGVDETYNQHRLSDINKTNLKIINTHVGLDVGEDGKTHQCLDYVGLMRNLYGFLNIVPADPNQTDRAVRFASLYKGNLVMSMGRSKLDIIKKENGEIYFDENYTFKYGKADKLRSGSDGAMVVMGTLANNAVKIVDRLAAEGIKIELWNVSCPTKADEQMLESIVEKPFVVSYEDHNINTGLGAILADHLMSSGLCTQLYKFGVQGYAFSGAASDVYEYADLGEENVYKSVKRIYEHHKEFVN
ncbi:MAG: transketolase [Candidatus Cloacimonadales bacterium]|jgi:transketolase|nr:transketolase [Candidatus Cloacimonadota bacterium]MDD2649683.1 transketolase [Candidatus Cloacimonadota bacterium]MDX9977509.1 transketolase [Candidatus Cloacimonadales bacterium]